MIDGTSALRFDYICDIPWGKAPEFAMSGDPQNYIDAFQRVLGKVSANVKISFHDDVWDFRPYFPTVNAYQYVFDFRKLDKELAVHLKFFVLEKISGKLKLSTIFTTFNIFVGLIKHISATTSHKSIYLITTEDVVNEINRRNVAISSTYALFQAACQVYGFLINYYKLDLPIDLNALQEQNNRYRTLVVQQRGQHKIPNIPEEYFNILFNRCLDVMRNEEKPDEHRMMAATIILLSQLGLRIGDLLALTTDALHTKKLVKSGNIAHFIHYTDQKSSKAHQPLLEFDIFCTDVAAEAFQVMKELRESFPLSKDNDFLTILTKESLTKKIPHTKETFRGLYYRFFYYYIPESQQEWENISLCKVKRNKCEVDKGAEPYISLSIPDTRQFRVHLATSLYEQAVPLVYIQRYMGHLSEYMLGYYVRPKDTYQENMKYSEKVIREIAQDDIVPLGDNLIGHDLKKNIKKFIADNGFNVQTDIEAIVKAFGDKLVIRGKTGGVCIKTSLIPCSQDARTNEMLCAYNLCPNLFHFYYMIDVSYLNFQTLQGTYTAMKDAGNTKAAQKELAKLRDLINRRLEPELDELEKEIAKNGSQTILNRYPSLIDIIEDRATIRKEIEEWKAKH